MSSLFRSLLFLPGNNPGMVQNGGVYGADAVILDLEDAVAPDQKDAARLLVAEALDTLDYAPAAVVVRINPLGLGGEEDLAFIVPRRPAAILLPKAQTPEDVARTSACIAGHETAPGAVGLIGLIETPLGVLRSSELAASDSRICGLAFGAEDYAAALGVARTRQGTEIAFARAWVVNSAQIAGVPAFDTPFTSIGDEDGLIEDTRTAKALGFKGKLCIHPRQVDAVHAVFTPDAEEIAWASEVVHGFEAALAAGRGAVAVRGKMIDAPIVRRAQQILDLARRAGVTEAAPCATP